MKKNITKLILLILCVSFVFAGCSAKDLTDSQNKYKVKDGEVTLTEVPNKSKTVEINVPDEYEGKPVTAIADFAASNLENVEKITIGKNVREIGLWAFENNQKLIEFEVSEDNAYFCDVDGVLFTKDMKVLLFYPVKKDIVRETVTKENGEEQEVQYSTYAVPEGVETIRTKAFYKCQQLRSVTLPSTLKSIEEKAFFRCGKLEHIVLPEGLETIGKDAFSYCVQFKEITIPSTVKSIGTYAFFNCKNLLKIQILAPENEILLEEKWQPTDNGKKIDKVVVEFQSTGEEA